MLTDYKIKSIRRDGSTTKVVVAFYEGEITTKLEDNINVTRYRRSALLKNETYILQGNVSDTELRLFLNKELAKDTLRTSITEQNVKAI